MLCTFPCFAILIASSKVESHRRMALVTEKHLLMFRSVTLRRGPWTAIFVVNSPFEARDSFMTPLCMCLGNYYYSLSDGRHGTLHLRERNWLLVTNSSSEYPEILPLEVASKYVLPVYWEGLWHICNYMWTTEEMCPLSHDCTLCLGYSVTHSEHNRLAINPNLSTILPSENRQESLHMTCFLLFLDNPPWQWHK